MNLTEIYNNYILWKSVASVTVTSRHSRTRDDRGKGPGLGLFESIIGAPEICGNNKKHSITITFKNNIIAEFAKDINLEYDILQFEFEYYGVKSLFTISDSAVTWMRAWNKSLCIEMIAQGIDINPVEGMK